VGTVQRSLTTARCIQATLPGKADHPRFALLRAPVMIRTISGVACLAINLAQIEPLEAGIMNGRFATAKLCRSVVLAGCVVAWPAAVGLAGSETTGAASLMDRAPLTTDAESAEASQVDVVSHAAVAPTASEPVSPTATDNTVVSDQPEASNKPQPAVETASTSPSEILPTETPVAPITTTSRQDGERGDATGTVSSVDIVDECFVVEICVDRYLWELYQRAPKEDSIKLQEQRKVTVRKKHRMVTVTKTFTRLVDEDFAWKDPKAAETAGRSMMDYVIGGVDRSFKLRLFYTLHAAEAAGLSPGITSAFRDDYRQSIASGLKAASNRSYHGGSLRGGYGHGLAADVVSVKGETRAERWVSTELLWKWIDAHGKEFGVGRPYLDRDPPHLAPIDGQEYATHYRGETTRHAASDSKKRKRLAMRDDHGAAKRAKSARSSKVSAIQARLHG
jgi:hypothetical protein